MIATLVIHDGRPSVPLPHRVLEEMNLRPGQFVRVQLQPVRQTPVLESDGSEDFDSTCHF